MARGFKSGGRSVGTPNRRTAEVTHRLAALGCDPIEGMAKLAMDEANPPELRGRMFAELAGFVVPKRKAIEFHDVTPSRPMCEYTDEELHAMLAGETERHKRGRAG